MAPSLAMMHRASVESSSKGQPAQLAEVRTNEYRAYLHRLHADLRRLSAIPSKLKRNQVKGELVAEYDDYIKPVIKAGECGQDNEVFSNVLIWCVDSMQLEQVASMLPVAVSSNLKPPRAFKARRLAEIVIEHVSMSVINHQEPEPFHEILLELGGVVGKGCLPDYVQAKLYKALGLTVMKQSANDAVTYFELSYTYNPKGGVKALLKRFQKITGTLPPAEKRPRNSMKRAPIEARKYDLSVRQAALMVGVSYQTFCNIVKQNPDAFSCYELPYGKGVMKRYRSDEVREYVRRNVVERT